MTQQESVEQKIRSACPELQELTFGCRVQNDEKMATLLNILKKEEDGDSYTVETVFFDGDFQAYGVQIIGGGWKIIGHPIQLQHVLRAIGIGRRELMSASTQGGGHALVVKVGEDHMVWNLTRPFSEQSEKVYRFLDEIL